MGYKKLINTKLNKKLIKMEKIRKSKRWAIIEALKESDRFLTFDEVVTKAMGIANWHQIEFSTPLTRDYVVKNGNLILKKAEEEGLLIIYKRKPKKSNPEEYNVKYAMKIIDPENPNEEDIMWIEEEVRIRRSMIKGNALNTDKFGVNVVGTAEGVVPEIDD